MNLSNSDIDNLANIGQEAALKASHYISYQANQSHPTKLKPDVISLATQVVTAIDFKSQEIILELLKESIDHYDLGIISEELQDDKSRFNKDYFWCIDPLDGTLPFTEQQSGYAVSIALVNKAGSTIIGIVADPYNQDYYLAVKGRGCKKNDKPFIPKKGNTDMLICSFDRSYINTPNYKKTIDKLNHIKEALHLSDLKINIGAGAVMNALGLLNSRYACYFKLPKPTIGGGCIWDFAATSLIYQELGLHHSDSFGKPLNFNKKESPYMNEEGIIYSTNADLYQNIIGLNET